MTQEALKLALEAMLNFPDDISDEMFEAITAIKKALAQSEQFCDANCVWTDHHPDCKLAQPEQEPVAWMDADGKTFPFVWNVASLGVRQGSKYLDESLTPLYTTPPQRTWVGLTDEEMKQACYEVFSYDPYIIARAIEAKLKEKNT